MRGYAAPRTLLEAGDREEVVRQVMRLTMQAPEAEIDDMQANPAWSYLTSLAHTCPYDMMIWTRPYAPQELAALQTPTLLLIGDATLPWLKAASETIAGVLPDSRIAILPGQDHMATLAAPDMVAREIITFLRPSN